ncbi:MAG TPA: Uma2 family endonuclease [Gammaproteobacteria bacterium]|nr:Uma2 family endonuclease [Gammaproteobacteria bacterium]
MRIAQIDCATALRSNVYDRNGRRSPAPEGIESAASDLVHELAVTWLVSLFRRWLGQRGGFVFGSEAKFVVGQDRGRKPDISVYLPERPDGRRHFGVVAVIGLHARELAQPDRVIQIDIRRWCATA